MFNNEDIINGIFNKMRRYLFKIISQEYEKYIIEERNRVDVKNEFK